VTKDKRWYLVDVWRARVDYPALKASARELAKRWGATRILVEDAAAGTALTQELKREVSGVIAIKPLGDKVSRMAVASAKFEAGQVFLPERAAWLPDLEAELFAFPGSRHDDQCDSISQALHENNVRFPMRISAEVLARSRQPGPTTFRNGRSWPGPAWPIGG
jgi:predicted phage terminase large subunit-like protein